jgi:pyridoxal phosphate enzyme (YggS family)
MSIAERLTEVRARIESASVPGTSVKLVAVSKRHPPEAIREAYAAGQRAFGENYVQELTAKAEALADLPDIEWHLVGHLQANKAKAAARVAHVVHTVDSAALARELGRRAAARLAEGNGAMPLPVLIEVNIGGEAQKAGASPGEIEEVMAAIGEQRALSLRGLMTMPPLGDVDGARKIFETLALLRNLHGGAAVLPELSMGMSSDFEAAVASGATIVRVGTAIFGAR